MEKTERPHCWARSCGEFLQKYEGQTLAMPSRAQLQELALEVNVKQMVKELGLKEGVTCIDPPVLVYAPEDV
jgi:hypothetical protein